MSKGSRQRPTDLNKFRSNYDAIFRKPTQKEVDDAQAEDEAFKDVEKNNQVKDSNQGG